MRMSGVIIILDYFRVLKISLDLRRSKPWLKLEQKKGGWNLLILPNKKIIL